MRNRILLTLLLALIVAAVAAPAQAATTGCDLTGDTRRANDCITHSHVGATADGRMRPGDTITIRQRIADSLRGRPLVVEVQMRRVARDGKKGPWVGLRRSRWSAADSAAHATRTIDVCRAKLAGRYEFRTAVRVPRSGLMGRTARQVTGEIAVSAPTMVALPQGVFSGACPNSPDDEMIIEYFNQIEFSEDIYFNIIDQGTSFALSLSCPPQQSPDFPPPAFGMYMGLHGAQSGVACNGSALIFDKATLNRGGYYGCGMRGMLPMCTFDIFAYNEITQAIFSDTLLQVTFPGITTAYTPSTDPSKWPTTTIIPNLNPATLPLCPSNFNPCVLEGTCTLTSSKTGSLTLCDSADGSSCTAPPVNNTYSYNENVYFQTAIQAPA
ncbi:MAG: hypothetical protein NTX95_05995 [Actinobacteria bacterium]|nr:hypothetical protein [Actinomycetota bacterium]